MLIEHEEARIDFSDKFETPVIGGDTESRPNSGDVHLYSDPTTASSESPMLYADCEGLEGGEEKPVAHALASLAKKTVRKAGQKFLENVDTQVQSCNQYPMAWAQDKEKSKREYSVLHLYPRLLFTFSDVVVFVLKNQR